MRVATWNVNSLKVRLPQVLEWLKASSPMCCACRKPSSRTRNFRRRRFARPATTRSTAARRPTTGWRSSARNPRAARKRRFPVSTIRKSGCSRQPSHGVRVVCLYVPNGQSVESDKYRYKLDWLARAQLWLAGELAAHDRLVVVGDFNIAPDDRDVHDPKAWEGQVLCSAPERAGVSNSARQRSSRTASACSSNRPHHIRGGITA